jgi:biuret amidohydrolase
MSWEDGLEGLPWLVPDFRVDPATTALMIIDMQNRAVKPDQYEGLARILRDGYPTAGAYYLERLKTIVPNNKLLLKHFRQQGMRVVFATVGPTLDDGSDMISAFNKGYAEIASQSGMRAMFPVGSPEHRVIDELAPIKGELVINKTTSGAFNSSGIDITLSHLGIDTLIFTGVVTDACVMVTARDASDRGYKAVLVEDACAGMSKDMHDAAMRSFAIFAGLVRSTAEIIETTTPQLTYTPDATIAF